MKLRLGGLQGGGVEDADAAVGAYGEGEGEGVPVLVGVGVFVGDGVEGAPVAAVVGGDVGAVGAYRDPGAGGGVVGYGGAVAVGWGGRCNSLFKESREEFVVVFTFE